MKTISLQVTKNLAASQKVLTSLQKLVGKTVIVKK